MDKYDHALWHEIFVVKEYAILDETIKKSITILDIGGYKGYFSKYCKSLNKDINIYLVEPVKEFIDQAKETLKEKDQIIFVDSGMWKVNKETDILVNKKRGMQSSIFSSRMNNDHKTIKAKMITLDNLIKSHNINKIDLMKMDIEGAEFEVMENVSMQTLDKIDNIFMEYHLVDKYDTKSLQNMLDKLSKLYKNIIIKESKYSKDLGYIWITGKQ